MNKQEINEEIEEIDDEEIEEEEEELEETESTTKRSKKDKKANGRQVSKSFSDAIKLYLDNYANENSLFAEKYKNPKKNIDECCNFIVGEVRKMNVQGLSDDEVYYLARHYYEEENLKVNALPANLKIVVNQHIELTEEEKLVAHEKAVKDFEASERKKLEDEAKKKQEKEAKALEKARIKAAKKEAELKARAEEQKKSNHQMSLFDFLGE